MLYYSRAEHHTDCQPTRLVGFSSLCCHLLVQTQILNQSKSCIRLEILRAGYFYAGSKLKSVCVIPICCGKGGVFFFSSSFSSPHFHWGHCLQKVLSPSEGLWPWFLWAQGPCVLSDTWPTRLYQDVTHLLAGLPPWFCTQAPYSPLSWDTTQQSATHWRVFQHFKVFYSSYIMYHILWEL